MEQVLRDLTLDFFGSGKHKLTLEELLAGNPAILVGCALQGGKCLYCHTLVCAQAYRMPQHSSRRNSKQIRGTAW